MLTFLSAPTAVNNKMRVLMDINQMLLDASEDHTREELAELTKQHSQMTVLAGQAVSFVLLTVAGCTITMEMLELYFDAGEPATPCKRSLR